MNKEPSSAKISRWDIQERKLLLDGPIYKVYQHRCRHPLGKQGDFCVIDIRDWVHAIALTPDDKIVMVEQYRFSSQSFHLEVPAGIIEPNESPIAGALRELREETGYTGSDAQLIATVYPNPAILNNKGYFVLLENCTQTHPLEWDHNEEIITHLIPIDEAIQMAIERKIDHSLTINALFFLQNYLHKRKIP